MGHNPSRYAITKMPTDAQRAVDEYKARSIWGLWWALGEETRQRFFNDDERKWIRTHGAKLDEIACLVRVPSGDKEGHFLQVCLGHAPPRNERERLWLRAQLVCRHHLIADRAARADLAEHRAAAGAAENAQLRRDLREAESVAMECIEEVRMLTGRNWTPPKRSWCNVDWVTPRFAQVELVGPMPIRWIVSEAWRGVPSQTFPPSLSRISQ
jgi:uncharacterized protein YifE (UPF0438 family)